MYVDDLAGVMDDRLRLVCKWLGSQFPQVKGRRTLKIKGAWKWPYKGRCNGASATVWVNWKWRAFPYTLHDSRYSNANCWHEEYVVNDVYELFLAIAGHELAHMQKSSRQMRASRSEAFCNKRGKELVELFRSQMVMSEINEKIKEQEESVAFKSIAKAAAEAQKKSPDARLAVLEQKKKKWITKMKRAQTAIKKLDRRIKYWKRAVDKELIPF